MKKIDTLQNNFFEYEGVPKKKKWGLSFKKMIDEVIIRR
jgi:hypothetical protein